MCRYSSQTRNNSLSLPTIEEDDVWDCASTASSSGGSFTSSNFGLTMSDCCNMHMGDAQMVCFEEEEPCFIAAGPKQQTMLQLGYQQLAAQQLYYQQQEDMLLAAIDVRLQELLRMREQCHAAKQAQQQSSAADAAAASTANAAAETSSASAARIAAAKLQEVQAVQRMQLQVQQELLYLLATSDSQQQHY